MQSKPTKQERVVLMVGAEGGSLSIVSNGETPARYRTRLRDQTLPFVGEGSGIRRESAWGTWSEAVRVLDAYPWRRLYPLQIAPDYRTRVWALIVQAEPEDLGGTRAYWAELCAIHERP